MAMEMEAWDGRSMAVPGVRGLSDGELSQGCICIGPDSGIVLDAMSMSEAGV
jgi:hypothetical protein